MALDQAGQFADRAAQLPDRLDEGELRDEGVDQFHIGDAVVGGARIGGFSEFAVTPAAGERLWAERSRMFFKPVSGFGSRAAYRGDKVTKKVWQQILAGGYVAQEVVPPSARTVVVDGERRVMKVDVRNYAYDGQVQLVAARLYQGQTTNFRTPGGGFAPVFVA